MLFLCTNILIFIVFSKEGPYLFENKYEMSEKFDLNDIKVNFPEAIIEKNGEEEIDYKALSLLLAEEICDLKDQLNEKDYQVTRIFERLERISEMV